MSKIIKANFRPPLTGSGYRDKRNRNLSFLSPEMNGNGKNDPAGAIVDAATVIRTARIRAARLLSQAEERVVELVTAAEQQAMVIRDEARQGGFEEGREAGYEDGYVAGKAEAEAQMQAELQKKLATIEQIAQECLEIRSRTIAQGERDILVLSLAIAEKILRHKLVAEPELTTHVVKDVAMKALNDDRAVIRVHPTTLEFLRDATGNTEIGSGSSGVKWDLVGDTSVQPGGCILETEFGRVDARLETRFLNVGASLLQLLEGEGM